MQLLPFANIYSPRRPGRPGRARSAWRSSLARLVPLLVPLLLFGSACAGGSARSGSGTPTRLLLRDFRTGLELELVNDSYEDRLTYYSRSRELGDTGRKFQTDEKIDRMLALLDKQGWGTYAKEGNAPRDGATVITSAFELERDGQTTHWMIGNGSEAAMRMAFVQCKQAFVILFQETPGFQAIDNSEGTFEFEEPVRSTTFR